MAPHLVVHQIRNKTLPNLFSQDTLHQQQQQNKTLHHLIEAPIIFPPTYKFKVGQVDEYAKINKRVPSWTDRILYATWSDGEGGAGEIVKVDEEGKERRVKRKGVRVEQYTSVQEFVGSDHKPVSQHCFQYQRQYH